MLAEPRLRASTSREFFGEGARFPNRRVFPVPFILRHYPIRGETHGRRKVLAERLPRYDAAERDDGWHVQYNGFAGGEASFLWDPADLREWDGGAVRAELLARGSHEVLRAQAVRGFEAERTAVDVGALGAWLGRTLGRSAVGSDEAEAALRFAESLPREVDPGAVPYVLAATRLLAGEARLNGRPLWAKELDEAGVAARVRAAHGGRVRRRADRAPRAAGRLRPRGLGRRPAHARDRRRRHRGPAERRRARGPRRRLDRRPARGGLGPAAGATPSTRARPYADLPRFDESTVDELRALALRRAA